MSQFLKRGIEPLVRSRFERDPVVILEGARATGKTSLLARAVESGWLQEMRTFMDPAELAAAKGGPTAYIDSLPTGTAIDEAQLAEEITLAIKARVDRDSTPGQIILTGSTRLRRNALGGSDPLAGRVNSPLVLQPMTLSERRNQPGLLLATLLSGDPMQIPLGPTFGRPDLVDVVTQTGLPGLLDLRGSELDQRASQYLTSVTALEAFEGRNAHSIGSLARYLAGRTSTLVNVRQFAGAVEIARATVDHYLAHLEEALLIHRLPGWRPTKDKSETAKPKIHFFDVGIAASLGRLEPQRTPDHLGRLAETLVVSEFLSQIEWMQQPPALYHWRHKNKDEVDLVIEDHEGHVICVEVKSSEAVDESDFRGIRTFAQQYPERFHRGFVFYSGKNVLPFGENLWAVPFSSLRPKAEITDPIETVLESISAQRVNRTSELNQLDARINEFVSEVENALERLGATIGDDYVYRVTSGEPGPRWGGALWVEFDKQEKLLLQVGVDLTQGTLTASTVPRPGIGQDVQVSIDDRPASLVVAELLAEAQDQLVAKLKSWDASRRSGPAV